MKTAIITIAFAVFILPVSGGGLSWNDVKKQLPSVPKVPNLPVPIPELPNVPIPKLPNVPIPDLPNVPIPDMPLPKLPSIPTPKLPNIPTPKLPNIPTPTVKYDCNACNKRCSALNPSACVNKDVCYAGGALFRKYVAFVETGCANDPRAHKDAIKFEQAKRLLIRAGVFKSSDFDGVKIRWCSYLGKFAGGIATSPKRIWIHPSYKKDDMTYAHQRINEDVSEILCLPCVLAHEMAHIRQYAAWGEKAFHCRYSVQMASGKGTGEANSVEREAYAFEHKVEDRLNSFNRRLPTRRFARP